MSLPTAAEMPASGESHQAFLCCLTVKNVQDILGVDATTSFFYYAFSDAEDP